MAISNSGFSVLPDIRSISCLEEGRDIYSRMRDQVEIDYSRGRIGTNQFNRFIDELEFWIREVERYTPPSYYGPRGAMGPGKTIRIKLPNNFATNLGQVLLTSPPVKLESETTFGEILAFRVWRVDRDKSKGLLLRSSYTDHIWQPGAIMKADRKIRDSDEEIPDSIRTGVHAWKSIFELADYTTTMLNYFGSTSAIIGRVKLWGDVVEHERGYRAEFARIESLDDCVTAERVSVYEAEPMQSAQRRSRQYNLIDNTFAGSPKWNGELLEQMREIYFPKPKAKGK